MGIQVEDVEFKDINKIKFLTLCSAYSLMDAVIFHPLSVAAVVAELHRSGKKVEEPSTSATKKVGFMNQLRASFKNNLSIRQSMEKIVTATALEAKNVNARIPPSLALRAVYTGFPITFAGLFLYDIFQMMPYNYVKSIINEKRREGVVPEYLPAPVLSGVVSTLLCTPFVNPPTVIFRQQVQNRCMSQPFDLKWILMNKLPAMEGGSLRVLFRGSLVGILTAVPAAALSWQLYETTRSRLETRFNSQSIYISTISGAIAGVTAVTFTRPISVVVSRMQTDAQSHGFASTARAIFKAEGIGAFYKGYLARILATAPRNGIFFSAYQTIITFSKRDNTL
jgi:hypothetical protein